MSQNLRTGLFIATAVGIALAPAQAWAGCRFPCIKEATDSITGAAKDVVNGVGGVAKDATNTANATTNAAAQAVGYPGFLVAQANGYADTVAMNAGQAMAISNSWVNLASADAASRAMGFRNYAERMARDSEVVGRDQYAVLRNDAVRSYSIANTMAKITYESARVAVAPVVNTSFSLANYVKGICVNQATNNWGKITPFVDKAKALDDNGKKAVYRILRTLGRGSSPDQQTVRDLKTVGVALGMVTANGLALVGNAYQSNFGISLGASGGWVAGVNGSVSFSMDTYPTNGKYKMAIAVNTGVQVAAGSGDLAPGVSIGFGLGWGPGSSVGASGTTMTAGGAVGGVDVAAQWTFYPALADAMASDARRGSFSQQTLQTALTAQMVSDIQSVCQTPGISAAVNFPSPGNLGDVTFSPGYTYVVWTGEVNQ